MICENCGKEHPGFYGSGRFCCHTCAAQYSMRNRISIEKLNLGLCNKVASCKLREWLITNHVKENKCEICGLTTWLDQPLVCELHHKDGNSHNNCLSNLMMVCPNCHSQTPTYKNKKRI